ncbi:MAG: hypothetical protein ACTHM0_13575 [Sphingomonas sp.]
MTAPSILDTSKVIVGATGSGKTVTAKHDVEQLLADRRHVVVIDPTGVWWGMRSNGAGDGPGFDLPIFGGAHGDLPIAPDQGSLVAGIVLEQRVSAIVDLSAIDNSRDWRRFMADFVAGLRRGVAGNFHLVVDEADEFAAERPADDVGFQLRENLVWIAKRGRAQGFVPTWITQRTAEIAKAVISQAQTIVAHQLIAPSDRKAIDDYLKGHGSADARKAVMSSLAELAIGERWIYSPRLGVLDRGRTPALTTFDSSRTPAPGERLTEPRTLAELDVSAIRAALASPPRKPESQNSGHPDDTIPDDPIEAQKGGVVGTMLRERDERIAELVEENALLIGDVELRDQHIRGLAVGLRHVIDDLESLITEHGLDATCAVSSRLDDLGSVQDGRSKCPRTGPGLAREEPATERPVQGGVTAGETALDNAIRGRKALVALAEIYPAALTEAQWATIAGYAKTGGTWGTYKGELRRAGLIRQDSAGLWQATREGCAAAGVKPKPLPPIGADRARYWAERVPGARRMVDVLIKRWPHFTTREGLAADLGMAAGGGTFGTYLGRARANGLLEEQGKRLRLAPDIMGKP